MSDVFNLWNIEDKVDDKYTTKVEIPQYLPSENKPELKDLCDTYKYEKLCMEIKSSNLPED